MFREMRRKAQQISQKDCIEILESATSGVLAVLGDEDYPYAVPVSYAYDNGSIYIHGAMSGHRRDAVLKYDKASFCIIDEDTVIPEKRTSCYRSVIAFGKTSIVEDNEEKRKALLLLGKKYSADYEEACLEEIEQEFSRTCITKLEIEHMTGKAGLEFLKKNKAMI